MMKRNDTNPLDSDATLDLTTDDVTMLTFVGTALLGIAVLLYLGVVCATHRIEALFWAFR